TGVGVATLQAQVDSGPASAVVFDASGNYSFTTGLPLDGSATGTHHVQLIATDRAGNLSTPASIAFILDSNNAGAAAPPVDPTVPSTVAATTQFLYTGSHPVQQGVAPGTINAVQAAVLHGKVEQQDGTPLSGVTVTV